MTQDSADTLTLSPIGRAHTPFPDKASAPRQPAAAVGVKGTIELFPSAEIRDALSDLGSWKRIWVLFHFHLAEGFRPKVLPPREEARRRGVFSTRSPHRPNAIGLSALRLDRVEDCILHVLDVDLVDGTPIFDIKPYVAYTDAFPDDGGGWLTDPKAQHTVRFTEEAEAKLAWLEAEGVALRGRVTIQLALGPAPHAYRRIRPRGEGFELSVKEWRVDFETEGPEMVVTDVRSGFRARAFAEGTAPDVHRAFVGRFST